MICRLTFAKERLTEDYHHKDGNPANNNPKNIPTATPDKWAIYPTSVPPNPKTPKTSPVIHKIAAINIGIINPNAQTNINGFITVRHPIIP